MIASLIDRLIDLDINIELVEHDKLKIHTDINTIPRDLLSEIKLHKPDLVRYLSDRREAVSFQRIPNVPQQESYVLSSNQRRLWILGQFEASNVAYNRPRAFVFDSEVNRVALERALNTLIARHESLRTVFGETDKGEVRQFIKPSEESGFTLEYTDLRNVPAQEDTVRKLVQCEFERPFDLGRGPMLRAALFQLQDDKCIFTYVMHHIVSDGWSMSVLINELLVLYNSYAGGGSNPLPPLRIQYKDYAAWEHAQMTGTALEQHKNYWLKHFEGELPVLDLPSEKIRPAVKTYNGETIVKTIDRSLCDGIKDICRQQGSTLFMGMLAAVNALFYRYTGLEDIIIGTPVAGREHIDLHDQIGFYANTLAVRTQLSGNNTYCELLENVKRVTLGAYEHQVYPFDTLVNDVQVQRDPSRNPLFDIQVIVENGAGASAGNNSAITSYNGAESKASVFDMVLFFSESADAFQLSIVYNNDVYSRQMVEQLSVHLEQLLTAITASPDTSVSQLDYLGKSERHTLANIFACNEMVYDRQKTIIELFKEQVSADTTAIIYNNKQVTYRELDESSDRLAHYLIKTYNVHSGQLIGVLLERSEKLIIALLGILKAGGVYVPVDPEYPRARKEFIISNTGTKLLVTQTEYIFDIDYYKDDIFAIDVQLDTLEAPPASFVANVTPQQLAYVIYTSGSTGEPKGVMIDHAALSASIQSQKTIFNIPRGARSLQFTSSSFDVSVFEIFITLASGATLYIIDERDKKDPVLLERFISDNSIEVASIPPAYLRLLQVDNIRSLKQLITGGEAAAFATVQSFSSTGTYYNAYGPTECSLCTSVFAIDKNTRLENGIVPIGKPIPNVELYIVDAQRQLVPVGVAGELCIGGAALARGYLNNEKLTGEKFIDNPFRKGEKLYRTGDIGRWMPDGNIEFLGRKDDQVKIYGHRVELGEVEKAVLALDAVESAIVVAKANNEGENELVAYIVSNEEVNASDMLLQLGKTLPVYMLPRHFVQLNELPLTSNGKIDKKKLPDPQGIGVATGSVYVAPRNATEQKLVNIWEDILSRKEIGVLDDYFELGGSSLKAMVVVKRILDETGAVVPLKIVFEQKTIGKIAKYIDENGGAKVIQPLQVQETEGSVHDASYNQLIYFSDWNAQADNLVVNTYDYEEIDTEAFDAAIGELIARHEILRTVFVSIDGVIKQQILPASSISFHVQGPIDIDSAEEMSAIIANEYRRKFDLSQFPLFDIKLYRNAHMCTVLMNIHHIITDGYSGGIFRNELMALYAAAKQETEPHVQPLRFQYRDFSNWQRNFLMSDEGVRHKDYWLQQLNGFNQSVNLPMMATSDVKGSTIGITRTIQGQTHERLINFARKNGLSITSLFMGNLVLLLNELSGQDDITVCTNVSGRNSKYYGELDVTGVIGFFANLLLVRHQLNSNDTILQRLLQVQNNFVEALEYDAYPIDKLINELPGINTASFLDGTVFFNYHNYSYQQASNYFSNTDKEEKRAGDNPLHMALGLSVTEFNNCLSVQLLFNSSLMNAAQRKQIHERFFALLNSNCA